MTVGRLSQAAVAIGRMDEFGYCYLPVVDDGTSGLRRLMSSQALVGG